MSYNRGGNMRRDGGNRRSNDFGGGNRRSSGNYYDNYNSGPMNPWEGGMVPGRGGSGSNLPSLTQGDLLSQLTSPEAQLALASNLINKLINQQQQSVPSLLNLNTMGSSSGHMTNFNDRYGNTRNFQDRRRGRMDQRRTEPYNKSGFDRRMGTDRRNLGRGQNRSGSDNDRKPPASISKSPKASKDDKDKKDKDAEKTNGDVKTEKDTSEKSKRDEQAKDDKSEEGDEKGEKPPPIPAPLLYCHVCSKNMWDEVSFMKHMKGRYHQLMMDGLNEKYKLKVDLLRHEMRLAEQQREMELERKQRQGFKSYNHTREYCAMCDLHFFGHLISHRKNSHHQKLKAFLHPKCTHCNKEFSTRLEWDEHRLSFAHLREVAEFRRATKPNIKDDEFDIDELVCPDNVNCGEMVSREIPMAGLHQSEDDVVMELKEEPLKEKEDAKKETKDDDKKEGDEQKDKEEGKEQLEVPQNIDVEPSKLPKYNPSVQIGKDLVVPVEGFLCRACHRFIQSEEEVQVHCRTLSHHNNFCTIVRAKARVTGRKKGKQGKSKEEKDEDEKNDESMDGDKNTSMDDEGNWKRRKVGDMKKEVKEEADESMEVEESKNTSQEDLEDSVWEEVDKDADQSYNSQKEEDSQEKEEEEEEEAPKRTAKGGKGTPRGRRGGRRGGK